MDISGHWLIVTTKAKLDKGYDWDIVADKAFDHLNVIYDDIETEADETRANILDSTLHDILAQYDTSEA